MKETKELCRNSYAILYILKKNDMTDKIHSLTIDEIKQKGKDFASKISISTKIKNMEVLGYIYEGVKSGRAKTYYIGETGIALLPEKTNTKEIAKSDDE